MNQTSIINSQVSCNPDSTRCWRTHLFPLLLLLIFLSIIYANSFQGAWIFDDEPNIVQNPYVHMEQLNWESITRTFESIRGKSFDRPFAYLTFGLNHFFHGLDTWGYHLVNFVIHCLSALFLYLFIFQALQLPRLREKYAGRAGSIALLATVLWATSPIQVTSVTFIVQRMASMAGMFFIMAMFFYLMGRITPGIYRKIAWFGLCLAAGLLSLATKENAVMLPVVLYLFDVLLIQGVTRQNIKRHLITGAVPLIFLIGLSFVLTDPLRILSGYSSREFTLMERLLTQPRILIFYLNLMLNPLSDNFALIHDIQLSKSLFTPWTTLPAILFWAAWTSLGIFLSKRKPLIAFCLLFFIINHLIESSFIPLELIFEHRNYIPSMTLYLLVGIALMFMLYDVSRKRLIQVLMSILICLAFIGQGYMVYKRNSLFEHPFYVWSDNVRLTPDLSRVHTNLGLAYTKLGMEEEAKDAFYSSIAVDRYHRNKLKAVPYNNLGRYYALNNDLEAAKKMYQESLEEDPDYILARLGLAYTLTRLKELEAAKSLLEETIKTHPRNADLRARYGLVLLWMEENEQAIREAMLAITASTPPALAYSVMGQAYLNLNRYSEALEFWEKYARLQPRELEGWLAAAYSAYKAGEMAESQQFSLKIISMKGSRTWDEFLRHYRKQGKKDIQIFSIDQKKLLPIIQDSMRMDFKSAH